MAIATSSPGNNPTGNVYVDSLIWGTSWNTTSSNGVITYSFDNGTFGQQAFSGFMKSAIRKAFDLIETIIPIQFNEKGFLAGNGTINQVDLSYSLFSSNALGGNGIVGFHQVPGDTPLFGNLGSSALTGVFAYDSPYLSKSAVQKGGEGFAIITHEILHGLGLAHPHDNGGGSSVFPGVTRPFNDFGTDGQNQAIFTIMSYNPGYASKLPLKSLNYGSVVGPMALDIAALQEIYGVAQHKRGDNVYQLPDANAPGTYWQAIWDTGGNDTISAAGLTKRVKINLNDADLVGNDAGGVPSYAKGIRGGFTIANGVVIENAIGGKGNDLIVGNEVNNKLKGRDGNDTIRGQSGNDILKGGSGKDQLTGGSGNDRVIGGGDVDNIIVTNGDGNDIIHGGSGKDWIRISGNAAASIDLTKKSAQDTGYGTDTILKIENVQGSTNSDQITGNGAENKLKGRSGDDTLSGQGNRDKLVGGSGNDTLIGGKGKDLMIGGSGADEFVYRSTSESKASVSKADVIRDFQVGVDKIDLSAIDASTILAGDDEFIFKGKKPAGTSDQGEVYYKKVNQPGTANDHTLVYVDTDNDKDPEMIIYLEGLHNLTADDFIF
ncbi:MULTISPECIES: M10 family metallopeptidase [unclassified Ruegeria]|uniref:M10 family metallopeptidase n=1 Tax=unclassified Ruegeria TaxID=2625375 RepID=UPI001487A2EB|nr:MULTISPECIES: M10 family metallopeptidase [unclassified Ruegeria]